MLIEKCGYNEIAGFKEEAAKENVYIADIQGCQWFKIVEQGRIIGFGGVIIQGDEARFKSDYILKEFRGKQYYFKLWEERFKFCNEKGVKKISAYVTDKALRMFRHKGFKVIWKDNFSGYTIVEKEADIWI